MKYCKKCIQPNTRPNIDFDEHGVCQPCNYFTHLKNVNWEVRNREILSIADDLRKKPSADGYHCVVSVSGGKDSTRQALIVRDELNLNPLLVSTACPRDMVTHVGVSNHENLSALGFDMITVYPRPETYRALMRESFDAYSNYGKATELALYSSAPKIANAYGIDMIFLGENNSLVYGEDALGADGGDASHLLNYNTLGGGDVEWMKRIVSDPSKLSSYKFPSTAVLNGGLKMRYLGYYFKDFNNAKNAEVAIANGMRTREADPETIGAINNYDALDEDFVHVNQMLKYLKFGFGKATDELCEMIRLGEISREDAFVIMDRIDGRCSQKYIDNFCRYIDISPEEFYEKCNQILNRDLFEVDGNDFQLKDFKK